MLKLNSTGRDVRHLQTLLNQAGARPELEVDGWFGPATHAAVLAAQKRLDLVTDGVAGPKTVAALWLGHNHNLLRQSDLERAAAALGVPLAVVMAVNEVESAGAGFLANHRPKILFERHVMHRRLRDHYKVDPAPHVAASPNIVNPARGGYLGDEAEHKRLQLASAIHADCAIESASWGLFQIMGWHWSALGYTSARDFAQHMSLSEGAQLDAFVRFVLADKAVHRALKAGKWAEFAERYNGPDYRANAYDTRIAAAVERFSHPPFIQPAQEATA